MNAIVRYSPTVQDVSVTDAHGMTLLSTDPDALNQRASFRTSLSAVETGGMMFQTRQVFGRPRVLDISQSLERNGLPFLIVHVGVRSTFLKNSYAPWLADAMWFALLAGLASTIAAAVMANSALRPIEQIGSELERLTLVGGAGAQPMLEKEIGSDAMVRVSQTINRLGEQMRTPGGRIYGAPGKS